MLLARLLVDIAERSLKEFERGEPVFLSRSFTRRRPSARFDSRDEGSSAHRSLKFEGDLSKYAASDQRVIHPNIVGELGVARAK